MLDAVRRLVHQPFCLGLEVANGRLEHLRELVGALTLPLLELQVELGVARRDRLALLVERHTKLGRLVGRGLQALQVLGRLAIGIAHESVGRGDDLHRHSEPLCDLDSARRSCEPGKKPERRLERLFVELDCGVADAFRVRGIDLQPIVVRRRDRVRPFRPKPFENGDRECGALVRIRSRADLVEQHERRRRKRLEHRGDVAHVRRERRQVGRE